MASTPGSPPPLLSATGDALPASAQRLCAVLCAGDLLRDVQMASVFANDSKEFVDMPLLAAPEEVRRAFDALTPAQRGDRAALSAFVAANFAAAGSDVLPAPLADWSPTPAFVDRLEDNATLRDWALAVHGIWRELGRACAPSVAEHPERHSLLWVPHTAVVAGGRFREPYYWDSAFIVRGLLVSGMHDTAAGVVRNLLYLCKTYGFVPNGGRAYYLTRSQPPMLSDMVVLVYDDDGGGDGGGGVEKGGGGGVGSEKGEGDGEGKDAREEGTGGGRGAAGGGTDANVDMAMAFLLEALPVLDTEYAFWTAHRTRPADAPLSHYDANTTLPRPESYREDVDLADQLGREEVTAEAVAAAAKRGEVGEESHRVGVCDGGVDGGGDCEDGGDAERGAEGKTGGENNVGGKKRGTTKWSRGEQRRSDADLYRGLAAAAESGWDFSSRWLRNGTSLKSVAAHDVLPVCVNAVLLRMELNMRYLHNEAGHTEKAQAYLAAAKRRLKAMDDRMWSESLGRWVDLYDTNSSRAGSSSSSGGVVQDGGSIASSTSSSTASSTAAAAAAAPPPTEAVTATARNEDEDADESARGTETQFVGNNNTLASYMPLWSWSQRDDAALLGVTPDRVRRAAVSLQESGLLLVGGAATTGRATGQQWDYPNAWPPLQALLIDGLEGAGREDASVAALAASLAGRWLETMEVAWDRKRFMFEKYDATQVGVGGGGGEYSPQTGFGWTNGVALDLLVRFRGKTKIRTAVGGEEG